MKASERLREIGQYDLSRVQTLIADCIEAAEIVVDDFDIVYGPIVDTLTALTAALQPPPATIDDLFIPVKPEGSPPPPEAAALEGDK